MTYVIIRKSQLKLVAMLTFFLSIEHNPIQITTIYQRKTNRVIIKKRKKIAYLHDFFEKNFWGQSPTVIDDRLTVITVPTVN